MLELRPYQLASIDALREGIKNGHKRQVLCAATGAGKSVIATHLIQQAEAKGSRVMFMVDRRVLVNQFSDHLEKAGIEHGVYMAGHWRYRPQERVQVASMQTLEKLEGWPAFDVLIVDEAHCNLRKSLKNLITSRPELKIIGLTATPFNPDLGNYYSSVTNVITMSELVDQGFLVPFRVFTAHEIDTSGLKVTAGEWQKDELEERGLRIVGDVVGDYIRIANQVFGGYRKTICFSSGVAHGAELVKKFAEHGLNFVQISYLDDDEYKANVLAEFAKPDTDILGLISTDILTRGFDVTDVEHVIIAKPLRKSFSQHVQMVGRGARIHPEKRFCVVQDHCNWLRFQDSWETLFNEGVKSLENEDSKQRKEPTEKEKKEACCPQCKTVWPTAKTDICPTCGFQRVRKSMVESVAGNITELKDKKEKFSSEYKRDWYWALLNYLENNNRNINRAYHLYRDKFGVHPAWEKRCDVVVDKKISMEAINYLKSANIAFAKRRANG